MDAMTDDVMDETLNPFGETDLQGPRRDAFLLSLLGKRKEAISGRKASGIEDDWIDDEDHYQGVDAANRQYATSGNMAMAKRWATGYSEEKPTSTRSVIFLNITRPYVDAASARVADMLLPTDDRAWGIKPTPIPTLSVLNMEQIGPDFEQAVERSIEIATAAAKKMQDEIDDCLNESNWHGEVRHVIEDSARIGSGVLKGPYPVRKTGRVYQQSNGVSEMVQVSEIKPGTKRIDAWNLFPDPACGESIHNGSYVFEREYVSSRQLRDMAKMPGYDAQEILSAIKKGPGTSSATGNGALKNEDQFDMWIFYGLCDADDLQTVGVEVEDETPKAYAMAVILNDRIIKCALNVLDTGEFPYDVLAWQRRPGMPWGAGVSHQIRTPQRMLVGASRQMMDNSGMTTAPQVVIGNGITPADGQWSLRGGKLWRAEPDVVDVGRAFSAFVTPSVQPELMNIINFALKMAEDTTGLPAMLQGIRGDAPETLGGMQLQNNNASGVLRRLAKRFDDYVTEPHIRRYYDWMMQHSDKEDIKGDFQVDVRASSALVERDAQQQFLVTLLQVADNPKYRLDPAKLATELLKGQRYDPKRVQYDAETLAQQTEKADPIAEAKAELIKAQTRKTDADAAEKNVTGMFSATSAANQIAMNPTIAPVADAMWLSAGGKDANAAPAIPEPQGAEGIEDLPQNTSPNFPPRPQSPDEGMNSGIETGFDDGN